MTYNVHFVENAIKEMLKIILNRLDVDFVGCLYF
nr:MAG TPA: hypothetical protein [Caudoviricetes sp.]